MAEFGVTPRGAALAREAWEAGEDCEELGRILEEVEIAIAERGADRDRSETELDEMRERLVCEFLERATR